MLQLALVRGLASRPTVHMILGIVLLVVGHVWLWLIRIQPLTVQLRGAAAFCAGLGVITILLDTLG